MTAGDLIKSALGKIGLIASGETPSAADQALGLSTMNAILGSWSTNGLAIPYYKREVFPLTAGKSRYTIGTGGDFVTDYPMAIERASWTEPRVEVTVTVPYDPGDPLATPPIPETPEVTVTEYFATREYPIDLITLQEWAALCDKTRSSSIPSKMYIEGTSPLNAIDLYPVPSSASGIVLYSKQQLKSFANAAAVLELPPGYERALVYNLAVELAPDYGKEPSAVVVSIAQSSKADIKRQNSKTWLMKNDAAGMICGRRRNILTGDYR